MVVQSSQNQNSRSSKARINTNAHSRSSRLILPSTALSSLGLEVPCYVEPMKARLHEGLPSGKGWLFEVKLDGIRAVIVRNRAGITLWSRRPRDMTADYPALVKALNALPAIQ